MSDYYDDEYYDDFEDSLEPDEYSYHTYLYKAPNGQLCVIEVNGYRYPHQDWGEAEFEEDNVNLNALRPYAKAFLVEMGKSLQPGQTISFSAGDLELIDDENDEGYGDPYPTEDSPEYLLPPADLDSEIPF